MDEYAYIVPLGKIKRAGLTCKQQLSKAECAVLAAHISVAGITSCAWELRAKPGAQGIVHVTGQARASLRLECVASLRLFSHECAVVIDTDYHPAPGPEHDDGRDFEIITEDAVDLGDLIAQHIALDIPIFPRAQTYELPVTQTGPKEDPAQEKKPFAKLSRLREVKRAP
ncbi:MAG: YceD family protein [Pseudomonadota bacterium]